MEFLYAIINFLILAIIIFIFGRKPIKKMFKERREKINQEIDESEKIEEYIPSFSEEEIPSFFIDENITFQIKNNTLIKSKNIIKENEEARLEYAKESLSILYNNAVESILDQTEKMLKTESYISFFRQKEEEFVNLIIHNIKLLPSDIAYLKRKDVLYVVLTSAFKLPEHLIKKIDDATQVLLDEVNGKKSFWVKEDPSLIGGLMLKIGDSVYDCTALEQLYQLKRKSEKEVILGSESIETIIKVLENNIDNMKDSLYIYQQGRVLIVSDGICWVEGLGDIMYGEVVEFSCGERGMVLDLQKDRIGCVIYGKYQRIESGSWVRRVGNIASVHVGETLLGRTVDAMGHAIDGKGKIITTTHRPIECTSPAILDRRSVCQPLHTGIKVIDSLVPIGKGQRELIIGDRQTGKSAIAIDTIINQKGKDIICIYVAIGQKDTTIAEIRYKLEQHGAMSYTIIVSAPASASASLQYIAPFSATAIGEYFMYNGKDVLIVYDDLSKHAVAYRELSLLLHRPSGREAYPGDIFYLHSRLLERSAKLSDELGGGSMTALPIIETLAGDIASYIPTNVISITDGQIFLETELFYQGQRPAINVGLSVSRVGSAAQTKLMKQISSSLRMRLAQYRELLGFAQFGLDIDIETKKTLELGERMMNALRQNRYSPIEDWKQCLLIYAVSEGFANNVTPSEIEEFEEQLYKYFEIEKVDFVDILKTGNKLSEETKLLLNENLECFMRNSKWQVLNN